MVKYASLVVYWLNRCGSGIEFVPGSSQLLGRGRRLHQKSPALASGLLLRADEVCSWGRFITYRSEQLNGFGQSFAEKRLRKLVNRGQIACWGLGLSEV